MQHVVAIKPLNPCKGGTCLKIISLHVQTFMILKERRKGIMLVVIVEVLNQHINIHTKCNSMMDSCGSWIIF